MGKETGISWATSTFNPFRGCSKVSAACDHCYAETMSHRNPGTLGVWGPNGTRVVAAESAWREPLKWDREAAKAGERRRVFCASLADVFEDWRGPMVDSQGHPLYRVNLGMWPGSGGGVAWEANPLIKIGRDRRMLTMSDVRSRLFRLICETPHLDWLVLTKRPENALRMMVEAGLYAVENPSLPCPQPNLWIGTSVENRAQGLPRVDVLRSIPAAIRFLSCEPLLEDLGEIDLTGIDLVICGGESGADARPMHPAWARSLRDQCIATGTAYHHKQNGEWVLLPEPFRYTPAIGSGNREYVRALDAYARKHGATRLLDDRPEGWDAAMIRDGICVLNGGMAIGRVGKKASGRLLDGQVWDQMPACAANPSSAAAAAGASNNA